LAFSFRLSLSERLSQKSEVAHCLYSPNHCSSGQYRCAVCSVRESFVSRSSQRPPLQHDDDAPPSRLCQLTDTQQTMLRHIQDKVRGRLKIQVRTNQVPEVE